MIIAMRKKYPIRLGSENEKWEEEQKYKNEINMIYGVLDEFAKLDGSAQLYLHTSSYTIDNPTTYVYI